MEPHVENHSTDEEADRDGPWFRTNFECSVCEHKWVGEAHYSTRGLTCPLCKAHWPDFSWLEDVMKNGVKQGKGHDNQ
jgi:hypothetical protein